MMYDVKKETRQIIGEVYRDGNPNSGVLSSLKNTSTLNELRNQDALQTIIRNLAKNQLSQDGKPTIAEVSVYAALHFYAICQQGQDQLAYAPSKGVQPGGVQLFVALANLQSEENTLDGRVNALLLANNVANIINELTHLIRRLKSSGSAQKIDFPQVAQDLCDFQQGYKQAGWVRLRWGEMYFYNHSDSQKEGEMTND